MRFNLEQLYEMLSEENPQLQIEILEDGNISVIAPDQFLNDAELMETLQLQIMKVTSMAASMGMFFPNEITSMLENYTKTEETKTDEQ